jgi:hypothetical protein
MMIFDYLFLDVAKLPKTLFLIGTKHDGRVTFRYKKTNDTALKPMSFAKQTKKKSILSE